VINQAQANPKDKIDESPKKADEKHDELLQSNPSMGALPGPATSLGEVLVIEPNGVRKD
jgi:hypothetical protein